MSTAHRPRTSPRPPGREHSEQRSDRRRDRRPPRSRSVPRRRPQARTGYPGTARSTETPSCTGRGFRTPLRGISRSPVGRSETLFSLRWLSRSPPPDQSALQRRRVDHPAICPTRLQVEQQRPVIWIHRHAPSDEILSGGIGRPRVVFRTRVHSRLAGEHRPPARRIPRTEMPTARPRCREQLRQLVA